MTRLSENEMYRGDTEEEVAAHRAFEAQLRHTAEMILMELDEHFHFADDCGDYLKSGLRLSSEMQDARMDGPASLLEHMKTLLVEATDIGYLEGDPGYADPFDRCSLRMDYAGDGVADALFDWAETQLPTLLTPEQWQERTGVRIMDPDGWRGQRADRQWDEPIPRDEFLQRAIESTTAAWPTPLLDEQ